MSKQAGWRTPLIILVAGCIILTISNIVAKGLTFNAASYRTAQVCH